MDPGFINLFDSLVHLRDDLPKSYKMAQLLAALRGEPRELVSHLGVTDGNYDIARHLLTRRYHNKRRLVDAQLKRLFDIPRVTRASAIQTDVLNPLLAVTRALENLGLPISEWSYMIVYIIISRLPENIQARFEQHHGVGTDDLPTSSQLIEFLEEECRRAENMGSLATPHVEPQRLGNKNPARKGLPQRGDRGMYAAVSEQATGRVACPYCGQSGHTVTACKKFSDIRVQGRRNITKLRGWCFMCLGPHLVRDCAQTRMCRFCDGRHHDLLCMNRPGPVPPEGPSHSRGHVGSRPQERRWSPRQGHRGQSGQNEQRVQECPREEFGTDVQTNIARGSPTYWPADGVAGPATGGCIGTPSRPERSVQTPPRVSSASPPAARWHRLSPPLLEGPRLDRRAPPPFRGRRPVVRRDARAPYEGPWDPFVGYGIPRPDRNQAWGPSASR